MSPGVPLNLHDITVILIPLLISEVVGYLSVTLSEVGKVMHFSSDELPQLVSQT